MRLELTNCARPDEIRPPSLAAGNVAADLRLIHRLRSRKPTELVHEIEKREPDHDRDGEETLDPESHAPLFDRVDYPLN